MNNMPIFIDRYHIRTPMNKVHQGIVGRLCILSFRLSHLAFEQGVRNMASHLKYTLFDLILCVPVNILRYIC